MNTDMATQEEINKLRAFKEYVHKRLDQMGVPVDPEAEKNAQTGCRIEGRLNYIQKKIDRLEETKWDHPSVGDGDL